MLLFVFIKKVAIPGKERLSTISPAPPLNLVPMRDEYGLAGDDAIFVVTLVRVIFAA